MNAQTQNPKSLSQDEIAFLEQVFKDTDIRGIEDFQRYLVMLRKDEEPFSSNAIYADLLEAVIKFLIDTKREYDEDRASCCPDPQEIDKVVDRVMLVLLRGALLTGYAPSDDVITLMKQYIKRHES